MSVWAEAFPLLGEKINWFPGHMYRALRVMKENLKNVDMFIEMRDARVPISSRNSEFDDLIIQNNRKKLIIFNKFDLCNQRVTQKLISGYNAAGINCIATSAQKGTHMKDVMNDISNSIPQKYATVGIWLMLCGMPNVGKSTIINQFRQISPDLYSKKALAKSTKSPCTTKNLNGIKILDNKKQKQKIYLVDSPGVMIPRIIDDETALKLSLIGCIKDIIPGKEPIIEYMVWALNKQKVKKYVHYYKLDGPAENAKDLFMQVRDKYRQFNYEVTYDMILEDFRKGKLGNITLDNIDDLGI